LQSTANMPTGVVPLKLSESKEYESDVNDSITKLIKENYETGVDLPISCQVSTLPFQDERCLKVMEEVDKIFKYSENVEYKNKLTAKLESYLKKN